MIYQIVVYRSGAGAPKAFPLRGSLGALRALSHRRCDTINSINYNLPNCGIFFVYISLFFPVFLDAVQNHIIQPHGRTEIHENTQPQKSVGFTP